MPKISPLFTDTQSPTVRTVLRIVAQQGKVHNSMLELHGKRAPFLPWYQLQPLKDDAVFNKDKVPILLYGVAYTRTPTVLYNSVTMLLFE